MKFSIIGTSWITEAFIKAVNHSKEVELISVCSGQKTKEVVG